LPFFVHIPHNSILSGTVIMPCAKEVDGSGLDFFETIVLSEIFTESSVM